MFTNKYIADKYGVSREAARQWANQFADYLSPTATPEQGRQRNYSIDDLKVFALIADMKAAGKHTPEIHAALAAGQRGEITTPDAIIPRSEAGINAVRLELVLVREQWERDRTALEEQIAAERARADRAEGALAHSVELLEKQLADREREIRSLYREIAQLEARQDNTG